VAEDREYFPELDDLFFITGRTEPAASTGKSQQVFVITIGTTNTGESLGQITTWETTGRKKRPSITN